MTTHVENCLAQWVNQLYRSAFISGESADFYYLNRGPGPIPGETPGVSPLNVEAVRKDFPILSRKINGKPLIWFDNAATSQKPEPVIEALAEHAGKPACSAPFEFCTVVIVLTVRSGDVLPTVYSLSRAGPLQWPHSPESLDNPGAAQPPPPEQCPEEDVWMPPRP